MKTLLLAFIIMLSDPPVREVYVTETLAAPGFVSPEPDAYFGATTCASWANDEMVRLIKETLAEDTDFQLPHGEIVGESYQCENTI